MQARGKIFDDISQLMTNAMGVAQGAKDEAETAMKSMVDRWLADRDFDRSVARPVHPIDEFEHKRAGVAVGRIGLDDEAEELDELAEAA